MYIDHVVFFWENITDIIPSFWTRIHAVAIKCHKDNMIQQFPPLFLIQSEGYESKSSNYVALCNVKLGLKGQKRCKTTATFCNMVYPLCPGLLYGPKYSWAKLCKWLTIARKEAGLSS